ncbi:MAG: O-antigen ligase family protein [Proteobacteria bacterium]|nr:O-antigen ligase family protein [Pseudomonadota bacterium]MBU1640238.1 O-antigen ligase family protein [Pseudomonadota bacterium]
MIKRLSHLLAAAAAFFLVPQLYHTTNKAKILLWAIVISGLGVALIGISQHLFDLSLIPQIAPPASTFANKNMAAHFVVLTIPAGMMLFLLERKRFTYLLPATVAIQTTFLAYARTRASWLALFISLALFILFVLAYHKKNSLLRISNRQKRGLVLGLVLAACLVGLNPKQVNFSGYTTVATQIADTQVYVKEPARQVRFALWLNTLAMARDHLVFGVGLGNFKSHYPLYHTAILKDASFSVGMQAVDSHNDILQALAELGLIGLGLFFWLTLKTLGSFISGIKECGEDQQIITACTAIGLIAFLLITLFSFPMACSMPPFVAALYLGLLANTSSQTKKVTFQSKKILGYGLITCTLFILTINFNYKELKADHSLSQFITLESEKKWSDAIIIGQKMVKEQPLRHQLITYLGRAYMNTGNLSQAENSFSLALKTSPADINTMANLGAVFTREGKNEAAEDILHKVIAIYPSHWGALNNLGNLWMKKGEFGQAKTSFAKAINFAPNNHLLWYNKGVATMKSGSEQEAMSDFKRVLALKPGWSEAQVMLNQLIQKQNLIRDNKESKEDG